MTDNPSISARHDAALEGIAAAGREIAAAVREAFQPVVDAEAPKAPPLFERNEPELVVPLTSRPDLIDAANRTLANFRLQPMSPEEVASARVHQTETENPFRPADEQPDSDAWRHKAIRRNLGMARLERERDEARAEVERLRGVVTEGATRQIEVAKIVSRLSARLARPTVESIQAAIEQADKEYDREAKNLTRPQHRAQRVLDLVAEEAQIDGSVPAGEPQGVSGGSGASGGLGDRLRALGTGQTRSLRKDLREVADEVDVLEAEVERLRAAYSGLWAAWVAGNRRTERVLALAREWERGDPSQSTYGEAWRDAAHALRAAVGGPKEGA